MMTLSIPKDFETEIFVNRNMRRLINALKKAKQKKYKKLAKKLNRCLSGKHGDCNSGACLKCGRSNRLELLEQIDPYLKNAIESKFLTLALDKFAVPKNDLNNYDLKKIASIYARKLRDKLPSNMIIIGGVDVSLNSFKNDEYHWQVHIHVLIIKIAKGRTIKDARKSLKKIVKNSKIPRPLRLDQTEKKTINEAVTYCLKSWFSWRSGYSNTDNTNSGSSKKETKNISLPIKDEMYLRLWLDRWSMPERLVLVGATNKKSPKSIKLSDTCRTPKNVEDNP